MVRAPQRKRRTVPELLRAENTGGALLAIAAVIALIWANTPAAGVYQTIRDFHFGPAALGLNLSVEHWASDGLLTLFFFVVGLELKREFTVGELATFRSALLPVVAAVGGMAAPAAIYLVVNLTSPNGHPNGWAVPSATDIAFSVAVLALISKHIPHSLRVFLLTLAVADDLLGIIVIAIFYNTGGLQPWWLVACAAAVALFGLLAQKRWMRPYLAWPIAVLAWYFMFRSGIHATIAGVLMGFTVPAKLGHGESEAVGERVARALGPVTYGFAVPVFALMVAGVSFEPSAIASAVRDPVAQGVVLGLVFGKPLGIVVTTFLVTRLPGFSLDARLSMADILAAGEVAGIGFTVSLLINELGFKGEEIHRVHGTMAVLTGSLIAALLGAALLKWRDHVHSKRASLQTIEG
ncbi:MAG: Na+/H+ antiporter NhaA [Bifidobacteriaceae bacterium]|jgi:NhaA family Na+:H+ antiporter|nr:Na+/H+ antiporter NhaA [Bifidobacteriaceae bacterium]